MKKLDSRVRTTEVDDVSDRLLVNFKKQTSLQDDEFLKETFSEIELLSSQITEAIKRGISISKLDEVDLRRNNAIRSLSNVILGYRSIPIVNLKENGDKLYKVFSRYGVKITKENYTSKSSLIESMLSDFSSAEMKEAIGELVGVSECIAELTEAQKSFMQMRTNYELEISERKSVATASMLKQSLLELINKKIITYLTAMKIANAPKYESFANVVLQVIENTNSSIRRRGNSKGEKDTTIDKNI
ncbi:MAG: DUF6261 family protein [Capnocytophaga sp.]|nr:DUF6261 family protein [Capnocytophaga sp.]